MQPSSPSDYKQLLTDVIKKQIVILGPDITLSKARNVKGLTVANDGTVTDLQGLPQEVTQALIDEFVQLSELIVKKTMEPLLLATQPAPQEEEVSQPAEQSAPRQPFAANPLNSAFPPPAQPSLAQTPQSQSMQPLPDTGTAQQSQGVKLAENPLAA